MKLTAGLRFVLLLFVLVVPVQRLAAALPVESYELRRNRAYALTDSHSPEAEPALKALLAERPNDGSVLFALGRVALHNAGPLKPGSKRREMQKRARDYFTQARAAGYDDPLIATALATINPDGTENVSKLSSNQEIDKLLQEGERFFNAHDYDKAIEKYRWALRLDPASYVATLYIGDARFASGSPEDALEWFNKACALDPNREIAHRYAADALMRLGKRDDALEQYLAAAVAEPYNGYPWRALNNYCKTALIKPWTVPANVPIAQITTSGDKNQLVLPEDFSPFDLVYGTARLSWQQDNSARRFPAGSKYRLTLEEETSALRAVVKSYAEIKQRGDKPPEEFAPALAKLGMFLDQLVAIEAAGMLEAHVLLVRSNKDVAEDYAPYRDSHREILHDYLVRFYLHLK